MSDEKNRGGLNVPSKNKKNVSRTNHLLVIGIDKYKNGISELNNAVLDAKSFRDLLWKQYDFSKKNTTCLFDKDATRNNIIKVFYELAGSMTEKDNLVIYFSGHGEFVKVNKKGHWIPVDAKANEWGDYISNNDVIDVFKNTNAHHIFAVVDSCFSGTLFQRKLSTVEERLDAMPSRWLLTAGRNEPVSDGSLGDHSPFADALLTYLKNNDKPLKVSKLCELVLDGVNFNDKNQTPQGEPLQGTGHYGGQFIFYPKGYVPTEEELKEIEEKPTEKKRQMTTPVSEPEPLTKDNFDNLDALKLDLKLKLAEDIGDFFEQFDKVINPASRKFNDSILQKGAYRRAKKDEAAGLASQEFINRTYARVRHALTSLIDDLKESDLKAEVLG